jgi:SsrA-binding protein
MPTLAVNKISKASYEIIESWEVGIKLSGAEVKSVKAGRMNLRGSYISVEHNEAWLIGAHISAYQKPPASYDPNRSRKLLVHKKELQELAGKTQTKGLTILPLNVYTKGGLIKVKIALLRGKKAFEKRATVKKRDVERDIRRALRQRS